MRRVVLAGGLVVLVLAAVLPVGSAGELPSPRPSCSGVADLNLNVVVVWQKLTSVPASTFATSSAVIYSFGASGTGASALNLRLSSDATSGFTSGWIKWVNFTLTRSVAASSFYHLEADWRNETVTFVKLDASYPDVTVSDVVWGGNVNSSMPATSYLGAQKYSGAPTISLTHSVTCAAYAGALEWSAPASDATRCACGTNGAGAIFSQMWPLNFTTTAPPAPPGAPTGLMTTNSSAGVALSWMAPGGPAPTSYRVYRSLPPGHASFGLLAEIGTNTSYFDAEGVVGEVYFYCVSGVNATLEGPCSGAVQGQKFSLGIPLLGDTGSIFGGSRNPDGSFSGGKAALGLAMGIPAAAVGVLWGIPFVLGLSIAGWGLFRGLGAGFGALGGVLLAMLFGFFPVWLVFFVFVAGAAGFVLWRGRASGGGAGGS